MLKLGIDCSEFGVSVALAENGNLLVENTTSKNRRASEYLVTQIQQIISQTDRNLADIEQIYAANGPGSFTGLKIGVTAAKVLAKINQAELFGVSSLKNLAFPLLTTEYPVLAMISARHGNFYAGIYQKKDSKILTILPDTYINFSVLAPFLEKLSNLFIIGSGLTEYESDLSKFGSVVEVESQNLVPRGFSTIILGSDLRPTSPDQFTPNYLRDPQAVLVWKKNHPGQELDNYVEEV